MDALLLLAIPVLVLWAGVVAVGLPLLAIVATSIGCAQLLRKLAPGVARSSSVGYYECTATGAVPKKEKAMFTTAKQVRQVVARSLSDAAELGIDRLPGDLHQVMFETSERVIQASALAVAQREGDTFPIELADLLNKHQETAMSDAEFAFRVAMALYTR